MNKVMQNELILTRPLNVETWRIQGAIAKAQARNDMLLVLQHLADCGGTATPRSLAKTLLCEENAREVVAERLLQITMLYGLTKKVETPKFHYALTEKGDEALKEKKVFIPEEGIWEITFSNDRLLPHGVVEVKPFKEPNVIDEVLYKDKDKKDKLEKRHQQMKDISPWIKQFNQQTIQPFLNKSETIMIKQIEQRGEPVKSQHQLIIEWNVSKQSVRLLNGKNIEEQFPFKQYSQDDVWQMMLDENGWLEDWDVQRNSMAIAFAETDDVTRQTMQTDLSFKCPTINELGEFNDFVAKQIHIHAIDRGNAIDWARWRLGQNINNFANTECYQQWCTQAQAPFAEYDFRLPERDELANVLWQEEPFTAKTWYAISASDWNL